MKNILIGSLVMFATILSLSSCKTSKNCGGGGWYGPRNLEITVDHCPPPGSCDKQTENPSLTKIQNHISDIRGI